MINNDNEILIFIEDDRMWRSVVKDAFTRWHGSPDRASARNFNGSPEPALVASVQPESGAD